MDHLGRTSVSSWGEAFPAALTGAGVGVPAMLVAGQPGAHDLPAVAAAHAAAVLLLHKLVAVRILLALIHAACTQEHVLCQHNALRTVV